MSQNEGTNKKENTPKAGKTTWVAPSFDSFADMSSDQSNFKRPAVKRQKRDESSSSSSRNIKSQTARSVLPSRLSSKMTWVEKYTPVNRSELAVHPKKIDDVHAWLTHALKSSNKAPILVLTGPPGTGKTATMRVLAKELGFQLREWITPINNNIYTEDMEGKKRFEHGYKSEYDLVKDFMLKSSRYPSVLDGEQGKSSVVLVEDVPLTFFRDPGALHDLLWEYADDGRSPLVFIVGENSSFRKLFPDLVISRLRIKVIEFNPTAMTIMTKLLLSIVQQESQNVANKTFQGPPRDVIDSIYESSCGDLRSAINTLQFACLRGTQNISKAVAGKAQCSPSKSKAKKSKTASSTSGKETNFASIGGRDAPDDFFRTIGRVLYAKREKTDNTQERGKLVHEPQDIVNNSIVSSECFTGFLHENYMAHFPVLKNLEKAADYLCQADVIMNTWQNNEKELAKKLGLSVAVQGLMYSHPELSSSAPRLGFRPQHKPRSTAAEKAYTERRERARNLFPNSHCSSYELLTELVPYIGQIGGASCASEAQLQFIESSRLDKYGFKPPPSRYLASTSFNQSLITGTPANGMKVRTSNETSETEEEMVIEDIDSD